MRKIISIFVVGLMVLSGIAIVGAAGHKTTSSNIIKDTVSFGEPVARSSSNNYITIDIPGCNNVIRGKGNPELNVYQETYYLPAFAEKVKVTVNPVGDVKTVNFMGLLKPSPTPIPTLLYDKATVDLDPDMSGQYYNNGVYMDSYSIYHIGAGRDNNFKLATIVTVTISPVSNLKYSNGVTTGDYAKSFDIEITWDDGDNPIAKSEGGIPDTYDMFIITPSYFVKQLQPLVAHKNQVGVKTSIKTLDDIYAEYDGFDEAESIKLFIKDAVEKYNAKYFMLVGGLKSYINAKDRDGPNIGVSAWHLPVRYTNIWAEGKPSPSNVADAGMASDLYFADLYKYSAEDQAWVFDSWDCDEHGVSDGFYAALKYSSGGKIVPNDDLMGSMEPDVAVLRVPARTKFEVSIVVNKIINYERPSAKPWYNRCIWISGDSFGGLEGEQATDMGAGFMEPAGFESIKVYASNVLNGGLVPNPHDIKYAISQGAGFVNFEGHGNPARWDTHAPGSSEWFGGIMSYDFPMLYNGKKLPVVIVGGCHNGQFNVTFMKTLFSSKLDQDFYYWTHGMPIPRGFAEWLLMKIGGGAIAASGSTGLGYGYANGVGLSSLMEAYFFRAVGQVGIDILGEAFNNAVTYYWQTDPWKDDVSMKCLVEWELFGDPSLKLGGY